jgi:hypothetical protein
MALPGRFGCRESVVHVARIPGVSAARATWCNRYTLYQSTS